MGKEKGKGREKEKESAIIPSFVRPVAGGGNEKTGRGLPRRATRRERGGGEILWGGVLKKGKSLGGGGGCS